MDSPTSSTDDTIHIVDSDDRAGFDTDLEDALRNTLASELPQSENKSISLAATIASGDVVAGLTGTTSYDWLHITRLWVADEYRRRGLGAALLHRAFERASAIGCSACWLETSNPEARAFYVAEGFSEFAELSNEGQRYPDTHRRWFLERLI